MTDTLSQPLRIEPIDASSAELADLLRRYFGEISNSGVAIAEPVTDPEDYTPPRGQFLFVRRGEGKAVGCGAVRLLDADTAEVKRMWLHPSTRGTGMGRQLLAALEDAGRTLGATQGVLDTHESLTAALALYATTGWQPTDDYNQNPDATHWFRKLFGRSSPT